MMTSQMFLAASAAFLFGASAAAQGPARVIGTVDLAPSGYVLRELEDRGIATDSVLDLSEFLLESADLLGNFVTDPIDGSVRFVVESAEEAEAVFEAEFEAEIDPELPGPAIGILEMAVEAVGPATFFVFATAGTSCTPLLSYAPNVAGTWWLETSSILTLDGGSMFDLWEVELIVPQDPALAGLELNLQAAVHQEPAPLLFLNAQKVVLWP